MKSNETNAASFTRTVRLKVRAEAYGWLNAAAIEVNQVFNWCNATSIDAADRNRRANAKFLSGFDLCKLSAGASDCFERINADCIQRINCEYAAKRRAAKKIRLRWRVSRGARRSLGWVPFKAINLKCKGTSLCFAGKSFRVFDRKYLGNLKWRDGCFAQDSCGDWWLCLPVIEAAQQTAAPCEAVGIDLGLKTIATTSDGETLEAGRWTHAYADRLATAQRRGHKRQAKRIHRKIARCRADALHKFSRKIVDQYQNIIVGDVSSARLVKTRMAKSVLDSGWGMLKTQLAYKSEHAGRSFQVVNETNTSRTCSSCGSLTGPKGVNGLRVRDWTCSECGDSHDRDVNAARNIVRLGSRCGPPCAGTSLCRNFDRRVAYLTLARQEQEKFMQRHEHRLIDSCTGTRSLTLYQQDGLCWTKRGELRLTPAIIDAIREAADADGCPIHGRGDDPDCLGCRDHGNTI